VFVEEAVPATDDGVVSAQRGVILRADVRQQLSRIHRIDVVPIVDE